MKTFPNWRLAGLAMRWARKQPGVTADRIGYDRLRDHRWRADGIDVRIGHTADDADLRVTTRTGEVNEEQISVERALKLLAALNLIPDAFTKPCTCPPPRIPYGLPDPWCKAVHHSNEIRNEDHAQ